MDGKTLSRELSILLREDPLTSGFIDERSTYDFLYQAACSFVRETGCITAEQNITTVATTTAYDLNADFLGLYMLTDRNEYFIKFYDTSSYYFPTERDYDANYYNNLTTAKGIPDAFSIRNKQSVAALVQGTATANGSSSGGESTLTDAAADFSGLNVGDLVHNETDGSDGVVIAKTSSTAVKTALFGGTNNDWTSSDAYTIVSQPVKQLVLDSPSQTSGYTITIPYIKRPDPVYSSYRIYNIDAQYMSAIVKYAAWLYKYRDSQPNFGDQWYKHWDMETRKAMSVEGKIRRTVNIKVNFVKRSLYDRSWR